MNHPSTPPLHSPPIPVAQPQPNPILDVPAVSSGPDSPETISPLAEAAQRGSPGSRPLSSSSSSGRKRSASFGSLMSRLRVGSESDNQRLAGKDASIAEEDGSSGDQDTPPFSSSSGTMQEKQRGSSSNKPKVSIFGFASKDKDKDKDKDKEKGKDGDRAKDPSAGKMKKTPGLWVRKVLKGSTSSSAVPQTTVESTSGPIEEPKACLPTVPEPKEKDLPAPPTSILKPPGQEHNLASGLSTMMSSLKPIYVPPVSSPLIPSSDPAFIHPGQDVAFDRAATIQRVQKRYDILCHIGLAVNVGTAIGQAAGGDLVGNCFVAVQSMWGMIQRVGLVETSAWRLVERCIDLLIAVDGCVKGITEDGHAIGVEMQASLANLTGTLQHGADLVRKLAERNFLKIFLRCDQINEGIQDVTSQLEDCVKVFHLQTALHTERWRMQSEADRKRDMETILAKIDEATENDDKMFKILQVKADDMQESIKTIQRTLDAVFALEGSNGQYTGGHLTVDSTRPSSSASSTRSAQVDKLAMTDAYRTSPLSALPGSPGLAGHRRSRPPTGHGKRYRDEAIATPMVREHVHFLKQGYDVLCRRSASSLDGLPNWTITRLEISRDEQVAYGNFSTVWRGTWQGQVVAIKQLDELTDKDLFLREVEIWKPLRHENILELWGASYSRPYFLVSPYMLNNNLLTFLRSAAGADAHRIRLMLGISEGMSYLHSRDVCHDLKAKNVLISNKHVPMICDFGLSELKMDIERKSVVKPTGGTLRWTAPEVLLGHRISFASDVFAFAITICEMLAPNDIPYGYVNSQTVRQMVLGGERCQIPNTAPQIKALVLKCWEPKPSDRPTFEMISPAIEELLPGAERRNTVSTVETRDSDITSVSSRSSRDTHASYRTAGEDSDAGDNQEVDVAPIEQYLISPQNISLPLEDDEESILSESSSPSTPSHHEIEALETDRTEKLARSYRHHLTHPFDDRFREPLWQPTACEIGDVGFLTPTGAFHTLFNAKEGPPASLDIALPIPKLVVSGPGSGSGLTEKTISTRNAALRAIDSVTNLTNSVIRFVSRQNGEVEAERDIEWTYSIPLSALAQPKRAGLVIYEGKYAFLNDREPAREYLKCNVEAILAAYGEQHHIKKEDIVLIVGGLFSAQWALMMASRDYGSTINFNVHKQRPLGEPWGTWSIVQDKRKRLETNEEVNPPQTRFITKVSKSSDSPQAVLLARLKFPTSGINRDVPTLH